ncbi:hypothetical protein BWQ96_02498 [Gracilariopsis chorda]|uniref:Putative restriction endonuclease domain-containing protein n=1 Tax=Gracilariopsis chorda TaxID=448386 RepID=A0A2V3J074_9FLOR|nr:hypothetical protein BWQ96_02498 [Gracilariopsis chorda]|eukprot:PXF47816.1 hypothetical protein BWQ96_02498 [Gracilariopsis chorda]
MSIVGTEFKGCMMHMQDYPDAHEIQPLTVSDYHVLIEAGCLDDYRVELLNGFLVKMHSQSVEHIATVSFLFRTLFKALENRAVIRDSKPITLMKLKSEPEPDIVIASGVDDDYNTRKPSPSDVLLVVEVSNSTLKKDSTIKLEDYALAGIPEYWIVDIKARNVQVLRKPQGNCYESKKNGFEWLHSPCCLPRRQYKSSKLVSLLSKREVIAIWYRSTKLGFSRRDQALLAVARLSTVASTTLHDRAAWRKLGDVTSETDLEMPGHLLNVEQQM